MYLRRGVWPIWIAGVSASLMALVWQVGLGVPDFPMDDAYIVQYVIQSLHDGQDLRYGGAPLGGATSPVHILLIWLLSWVLPVPWAQFLVAVVAFVMWVTGATAFAHRAGIPWHGQALLAGLSASTGMVFYQSFNGLETGLAMAIAMWALTLFYEPVRVRSWHAIVLGAMPFVRPELAVLSGLLFVRHCVASRQPAWERCRAVLPWCFVGVMPPLVFVLWGGGSVLPNTVMAKAYFFAEGCLPWGVRLARWAEALQQFSVGLGLGWACFGILGLLVSRVRWVLGPFVVVFLFVYLDRLPGALFHNWHRYLYVLMPVLVAGWAALMVLPIRWARLPFVAMLVVAVAASGLLFWDGIQRLRGGVDFTRRELAGVSAWVATHVPERSTVLVHDAGHIALAGRQHLVDVVGLKSPPSVQTHAQYTWARCSRRTEAVGVIAERAGAQYFVILSEWDGFFHLTDNLREAGWAVTRVDKERGETAYRVYRIQLIR